MNYGKVKNMIVGLIILSQAILAQNTIVLKPSAAQGKDAVVGSLVPAINYGSHPEFVAMAGTNQGVPTDLRSLIEFDFSSIPQGSVINSAKLSLYSYDSPTNGKHRLDGGSNEATISRITSPWSEDLVTWNNQPSVSVVNQVTLAGSNSTIQDYLNIDVTALVSDMFTDAIGNHGFLFQLVTEQYYRTMLFASSDYSDANLHPELEITYTAPSTSCLVLKPSAAQGKDAVIGSLVPAINYGSHPEFVAMAGTNQGVPTDLRSLIEFDFSSLPQGAVIDSAKLSLYSYDSPTNGKHRLDGGSNEATISRITSAWSEDLVTWNNQPSVSVVNQVTLAGSNSTIQDYLDIDVTALVKDMVTDVVGNHGFLFQLVTEQYYRTMLFASSDYSDANLHPKLEVCYSINTQVEKATITDSKFTVYPNPTENNFIVQLATNGSNVKVEVVNATGQLIVSKTNVNNITSFDASVYPAGLYFVKVYLGDSISVQKLIVR